VLNAACRDLDEIRAMKFPVYALGEGNRARTREGSPRRRKAREDVPPGNSGEMSMAQTASEKIPLRAAAPHVKVGEIIYPEPTSSRCTTSMW